MHTTILALSVCLSGCLFVLPCLPSCLSQPCMCAKEEAHCERPPGQLVCKVSPPLDQMRVGLSWALSGLP
ncbi:hypothetical protein CCMA1212_004771 [Trichoderma ghanense]|uniref:SSCRP protein n=1 Tax=Trichoderma ghanense TaxID=65468 RepID=A0ABY2H7G6_9HYPO